MGPVAERCRLGRLRGRRLRKFPLTLRLPAIVEMRTRTHERESNPYFPDVLLHFQALASFQLGRYEEAVDLLMHRLARNAVTDVSRALLATAIWAVSPRPARHGRRCFPSIPTIRWNTVAKFCPTRTLPNSNTWWMGSARPVSCNDRCGLCGRIRRQRLTHRSPSLAVAH